MQWYEAEVKELEQSGRALQGQHPAVFYGSSSVRLWETIDQDLHSPGLVNRAFGGSTLEACVYFFDRLIRPIEPRSLALYAGDNDLGDGRSPEQVLAYFAALLKKVDPAIPFAFVSIKPSPARRSIIDRIRKTNQLIEAELAKHSHCYFIDVFSAMLNNDGSPRPDLFLEDGLHMNKKGYEIWAREIEPFRQRLFMVPKSNSNTDRISLNGHEAGVPQVVQPASSS